MARVTFSGSVPASTVDSTRASVAANPVSVMAFTSDVVTPVYGAPTTAPTPAPTPAPTTAPTPATTAPTPGPTMGDSGVSGSSGSSDDDQGTVMMLIIIIAVIALIGIAIVIVLYNRRGNDAPGAGGRTVYTNPAYGTAGVPPANLESVELSAMGTPRNPPGRDGGSGLVKVESMC